MEVQTRGQASEMSWTFGTCKSTRTYYSDSSYTESCCIVGGIHQLACKDSAGNGWNGGFLKIGGTVYCKDFRIGYQQTCDIDISGNYTILNTQTPILFFDPNHYMINVILWQDLAIVNLQRETSVTMELCALEIRALSDLIIV